jgi:hypothetical protein
VTSTSSVGGENQRGGLYIDTSVSIEAVWTRCGLTPRHPSPSPIARHPPLPTLPQSPPPNHPPPPPPLSTVFEVPEDPAEKSFFSEIIASISDAKFSRDGMHIIARDYMSLKLWDIRSEARPVHTFRIHDQVQGGCVYENNENNDMNDVSFVRGGVLQRPLHAQQLMQLMLSNSHGERELLAKSVPLWYNGHSLTHPSLTFHTVHLSRPPCPLTPSPIPHPPCPPPSCPWFPAKVQAVRPV